MSLINANDDMHIKVKTLMKSIDFMEKLSDGVSILLVNWMIEF